MALFPNEERKEVMNVSAKLILRVAKKLGGDERSELIGEMLKLRAEEIGEPRASAVEHVLMYERFLDVVRDACETEIVSTGSCRAGCERYEESLRHGGCVECIYDASFSPAGLRITPELWCQYKPHVEYASMVLGLTLTEAEAFDVYFGK